MNIKPKTDFFHGVNDALLFFWQGGDCRLVLLLDAFSPFAEVLVCLLITLRIENALGSFISGGVIEDYTIEPVNNIMQICKGIRRAAFLAEHIRAIDVLLFYPDAGKGVVTDARIERSS